LVLVHHDNFPETHPERDDALLRLDVLQRQLADERRARATAEQQLEQSADEVRQLQRALREVTSELECRVEERAAQIRAMEAELRQSHKMEAVGLLAGGIAHDFNNLLTIMSSASEMLFDCCPESEHTVLEELRLAVTRGRDLTRQLLVFSRSGNGAPEKVDVAEAVCTAQKLLRRLLPAEVSLVTELTPLLVVQMEAGALDQVLINLAANARDAMPRGGELRIRASARTLCASDAEPLSLTAGPYVMLEVADTGMGMPPDVVQRVFDPFFSTKPVGRGTGLGLANVYTLIRQAHGHVSVDSHEGMGTVFRFLLPRCPE
jgi:two-component system, cell cycle sensor histidine kinase and response regulator CckA